MLSLVREPGRVWSRDALLDAVWPEQSVGEEVLTQAITELRRALGDDFRQPRFIETVHKTGYRLLPRPGGDDGGGALYGGWAGDLEAYAVYLEADALRDSGGRIGLKAAIDLYGTALLANPRLAAAHVGVAGSMLFTVTHYCEPADVARIRDHCEAAVRLDSGLAEAWAMNSHVCAYAGRLDEAMDVVSRALALHSVSGSMFYYAARVCMAGLRLRPAAALLERAARLTPADSHSLVLAGKMRAMLGDEGTAVRNYAAALPRLNTRLAENPDDFRARADRARCLESLGQREEAAIEMDLARAHPDPMPFLLANTLAQNGRAEAALDALEATIDAGWRGPWARPWLDRDTDFDALRGTRRFARLAAQVGAAA